MTSSFRAISIRAFATAAGVLATLAWSASADAQQMADPDFDTSVPAPSYPRSHPRVSIDEAHDNFHTAEGRYKPLAELLRHDGYDVRRSSAKFRAGALPTGKVLIVANAGAIEEDPEPGYSAFSDDECKAVREWVRGGGSLLLIADHAPFGGASAQLAREFGVEMGQGYVFDLAKSLAGPTILLFTRDNEMLSEHAITQGRSESERVERVVSFTGQSLSIPSGGTPLMKLGATAYEVASGADVSAAVATLKEGKAPQEAGARSVAGRAQGVAVTFGKGRVVVLGEAAMFSAQLFRESGKPDFRFGMNAPGNDDKQFALNVMHWLSGAL